MPSILSVKNLSKTYVSGSKQLQVLQDISFSIEKGKSCSIVGPSGSGKTTLLGLCAGLDAASNGEVFLHEEALSTLSEDERAAIRNKYVGFIFQSFNLMPTLTALENVMVPLELQGKQNAAQRAKELLDKVGLSHRYHHYPTQLSGGEQQRVSIARAFSNDPEILFADEPTGNLDEETGSTIEELIFNLNKEKGTTLIMVTHDNNLAKRTDRILQIKGGKLIDDTEQQLA